ncbi:DsbA family protein [Pelagibacteraceae bacterium]|nr:DsbA family protein [Pelagibacteraceae bacterium]MDC0366018.1 DsbA family protein [Pelagibacteraceae bacterium]
MKKINNFIYIALFFFLITFSVNAENKILSIGSNNAKITVKVFSSLTCPHCANFHTNIFEKLKEEYINHNLVRFEHHSFPLDLGALNAEIIVRCHLDNNKRFKLLGEIYKKQNKWAVGSDINVINELIKKIGLDSGLSDAKMNKCLEEDSVQDQILNERIEAQKKYKIQSTPTIFINENKYENDHEYKSFKKVIDKLVKKYEI